MGQQAAAQPSLAGTQLSSIVFAAFYFTHLYSALHQFVLVSLVADANQGNGFWLWVTTDNLRIAALTAVECAETMTASRPKGQIQ